MEVNQSFFGKKVLNDLVHRWTLIIVSSKFNLANAQRNFINIKKFNGFSKIILFNANDETSLLNLVLFRVFLSNDI